MSEPELYQHNVHLSQLSRVVVILADPRMSQVDSLSSPYGPSTL